MNAIDRNQAFLGKDPSLYEPDLWRPAQVIPISAFRQIFLWPLALHSKAMEGAGGAVCAIKEVRKQIGRSGLWKPVDDLSNHAGAGMTPADKAQRYAEFVFFHDFIQNNLFGPARPENGKRPIALYERIGRYRVRAMADEQNGGGWFEAEIVRFNLYSFSTGAAMLVLEIDFGANPKVRPNERSERGDRPGEPEPMTLAHVQTFIDLFRRAYVPYFYPRNGESWTEEPTIEGGGEGKAGLVMRYVSITSEDERTPLYDWTVAAPDPAYDLARSEASVRIDPDPSDKRHCGSPPVFAHWKAMIAPLVLSGTEEAKQHGAREFRQVVDERVPCMSFVALAPQWGLDKDTVRGVTRGDWIRLCFADRAGTDTLPYSHHFLGDFETECCYDRFFPSGASTEATSRIVCAGYHFAMVGAGGFFETTMVTHFRRHYFQLGLAVHMELASLLATSSRVTSAVREFSESDNAETRWFQGKMQAIHSDFLEFVHLFRFTGMSNQLQPSELLALWRKRLGLQALFEDVKDEIETANAFLFAKDAAGQTEKAGHLNVLAAIGVVFSLAFSFLALNPLFDSGTFSLKTARTGWMVVFGVSAIWVALGLGLYKLAICIGSTRIRWVRGDAVIGMLAMLVAGLLILTVLSYFLIPLLTRLVPA